MYKGLAQEKNHRLNRTNSPGQSKTGKHWSSTWTTCSTPILTWIFPNYTSTLYIVNIIFIYVYCICNFLFLIINSTVNVPQQDLHSEQSNHPWQTVQVSASADATTWIKILHEHLHASKQDKIKLESFISQEFNWKCQIV